MNSSNTSLEVLNICKTHKKRHPRNANIHTFKSYQALFQILNICDAKFWFDRASINVQFVFHAVFKITPALAEDKQRDRTCSCSKWQWMNDKHNFQITVITVRVQIPGLLLLRCDWMSLGNWFQTCRRNVVLSHPRRTVYSTAPLRKLWDSRANVVSSQQPQILNKFFMVYIHPFSYTNCTLSDNSQPQYIQIYAI